MLFQIIHNEVNEIHLDFLDQNALTAGIITLEELKKYNHILNFSDFSLLECEKSTSHFRSPLDIYSDYSFGVINIANSKKKISFFIKKNLFLIVDIDSDNSNIEKLLEFAIHRFKTEELSLELLICSFLEGLIYKDNELLEIIEFEINAFEDETTDLSTSRLFIPKMLSIKKRMLLLHNYYEQLIDIGQELKENKNKMFNTENLYYFDNFTDKVVRISKTVQRLRENLVQIREAYQSNMDFNNNNIMKMFTVVTTIFMPLTLLVGWYGMNFSTMPNMGWESGYAFITILSIIIIIFCIWLFKRKNLL